MKMKFDLYLGAMTSALTLVVLVIAAELAEPLKEILKILFWHHWIGKGIIVYLVFLVSGLIGGSRKYSNYSNDRIAWYSVLGSLALIFAFYLLEYML